MTWDEEEPAMDRPLRAHKPMAEVIVAPGRRYRHPAVHAEIQRRVAIYIRQMEEHGYLTWLPMRGEGKSS